MNGLKTDTIINRDALYALRELPEESVHCCVTSPPYYALRDYGLDMQIGREDTPEQYIDRLTEVFRELRRVLRSRYALAEYRGHLLRHREQGLPCRPEEPERQKRTADCKKQPRFRLQTKGLNRYPLAFSLCPTR